MTCIKSIPGIYRDSLEIKFPASMNKEDLHITDNRGHVVEDSLKLLLID